jgi:RNA polymerase sigma-70 factor, ECF subfamily
MNGDQKSYAMFLERVAGMLRTYLKKSVNPGRVSNEQVEDLIQDVLMAIHQKRSTYRIEMPLMPWLYSITRYRLIDSYRAEGRKPMVLSFDENFDLNEIADESEPQESNCKAELEVVMGCLSDKQKQVLHLAKVEELPLAEVSVRMKMSLSSVKVTIHRAMEKLKRNAGEEVDREDK